MPPLMKIVSAISAGAGFRPQPETERARDERRQRAIAQCVSAFAWLHHRLIWPPFLQERRQAENTRALYCMEPLSCLGFVERWLKARRAMRSLHAPKAHFDESIALIEAGDLAAAEARIRSRLADYPRDVNLQALLGALLVKQEPPGRSGVLLRQVIAEAPSFAKPHEDLGYLLVQLGDAADAVPLLERATHLDPTLESAWFTLGKAPRAARAAAPKPTRPSSAASSCRRSGA